MDVPKMSTSFGLLTQSQGSDGPPDRYVVAQLSKSSRGGGECRRVVRRFLSETGEWDERPLVGVVEMEAARSMLINHEVLALGDRLWYRHMGVSEGKLRYVQVSNRDDRSCVILSFSLDDETYSWALDHSAQITDRRDRCHVQIAAIDPFKANLVYLQHGGSVIALLP
uniref:Uncharacterized protein n=1 Tax=Aegilops tauschii TaxID=37682 RepID=R7WEA8_AEGTA